MKSFERGAGNNGVGARRKGQLAKRGLKKMRGKKNRERHSGVMGSPRFSEGTM